ncbi:MAG: restriction endonuclease [Armatimonadetes bacterium]|nr:restriction endonuclease [Armatimonadota bacterium]
MLKSDLPFGSEFSPAQIDLPVLLEAAAAHGGDWHAFEAVVWERYFASHTSTSEYNQRKLANNTKLGMQAYGIIDDDARLTTVGESLYALREDAAALHAALGRHVLLMMKGMVVLQCVQDMQAAGEVVDLNRLRKALGERGVHVPRGGKHMSTLRLWLERAGVLYARWRVNEERVRELLGLGSDEIDVLAGMTPPQRAFLKALANIGEEVVVQANRVERLAAATYGVQFNEKALAKDVLYPLRDAGYLVLERGTKEPGRGAKSPVVRRSEKFVVDVALPLLEQFEGALLSELRPVLRRPLGAIMDDLSAADKHTRGLALEALAIRLMRLVDLTYVATRLRGTATAGAEVDIVFETDRLLYSRWQVQCKNTSAVALDDVAKEVGLTHMLKSNAIVIVSTGKIGPEARRYANSVMGTTNLCIVMLDGHDLDGIRADPTAIMDVLNREASSAMALKRLEK